MVSVPSGCDDLSWIENCYDWLEKFNSIVIFGDNDPPGQKMDNVMSLVADQAEETAAQRAMIVRLKSFAQRFKCHIILVAHPRKAAGKDDSVLTKDSVSGSSSMVNFCDSAFTV